MPKEMRKLMETVKLAEGVNVDSRTEEKLDRLMRQINNIVKEHPNKDERFYLAMGIIEDFASTNGINLRDIFNE